MGRGTVPGDTPRWQEVELEGRGLVTTDFHGDIRAFEHVEHLFRTTGRLRWWIDLGDKGDAEKRRMEDYSIPPDGDSQILARLMRLKSDIRLGRLPNKRFLELLGNHDHRDLTVYRALRDHHMLSHRRRLSLAHLLERLSSKVNLPEVCGIPVPYFRRRFGPWIRLVSLKDPGLTLEEAEIQFLIRVVLCQHGFAMRMRKREFCYLDAVQHLVIHLPKAGIVFTHGGVPKGTGDPREVVNGPEMVRRAYYWNRYPTDYRLKHLRRFLRQVGASLLVVGHTPPGDIAKADRRNSRLTRGVAVTAGQQLTFTSGCGAKAKGAHRVFLEFDASRPFEDVRQVKVHRLP